MQKDLSSWVLKKLNVECFKWWMTPCWEKNTPLRYGNTEKEYPVDKRRWALATLDNWLLAVPLNEKWIVLKTIASRENISSGYDYVEKYPEDNLQS